MTQNYFFVVLTLFVAVVAISYKEFSTNSLAEPVPMTVVDEVEDVVETGPTTTITSFPLEN